MERRLEGKAALVTGASSGIGRSIAVRLGREGAAVEVNHLADGDKGGAEKAVREVTEAGGRAVAVQGDVSKEEDAKRMVREIAEGFGRVDVLVNNAGIENERPFLEMALADWEKVVSVNLTGAFLMSREALKVMVENGSGTVVNISSVHERIPWPRFAHYAATKGGVKMLTETLALEFAKRGVRVNAVAPGAIATPINREKLDDPEQRTAVEKLVPWGRWGELEEVASCVAFLASDEASYVTGATLFVDGGMALYPGFEAGGGSGLGPSGRSRRLVVPAARAPKVTPVLPLSPDSPAGLGRGVSPGLVFEGGPILGSSIDQSRAVIVRTAGSGPEHLWQGGNRAVSDSDPTASRRGDNGGGGGGRSAWDGSGSTRIT